MAKEVSKYVIPIGALILGYYVLKSWGIISTPCDPSICTPLCPRGPKYSRGFFGDCDPNYLMCGWLQENCCCLSATGLQSHEWIPLTEQEINRLTLTS